MIVLDSDMEEFEKYREKVLRETFGKDEAERILNGKKGKSSKDGKEKNPETATGKQTKKDNRNAEVPARFADDLQQTPVDINKIKWASRPTNKEDW